MAGTSKPWKTSAAGTSSPASPRRSNLGWLMALELRSNAPLAATGPSRPPWWWGQQPPTSLGAPWTSNISASPPAPVPAPALTVSGPPTQIGVLGSAPWTRPSPSGGGSLGGQALTLPLRSLPIGSPPAPDSGHPAAHGTGLAPPNQATRPSPDAPTVAPPVRAQATVELPARVPLAAGELEVPPLETRVPPTPAPPGLAVSGAAVATARRRRMTVRPRTGATSGIAHTSESARPTPTHVPTPAPMLGFPPPRRPAGRSPPGAPLPPRPSPGSLSPPEGAPVASGRSGF